MTDILLAAILIIVIVAIAWYLVKKLAILVVNAVLGLIFLFIIILGLAYAWTKGALQWD